MSEWFRTLAVFSSSTSNASLLAESCKNTNNYRKPRFLIFGSKNFTLEHIAEKTFYEEPAMISLCVFPNASLPKWIQIHNGCNCSTFHHGVEISLQSIWRRRYLMKSLLRSLNFLLHPIFQLMKGDNSPFHSIDCRKYNQY